MKFIQFPWRFLLLAGFVFSAASGYLFKSLDKKKYTVVILIIIFVLSYMLYGGFFKTKGWNYITDAQKFSGQNWTKDITASIYDYLPVSAKKAPDFEAKSEPVFVSGSGKILSGSKGTNWQNWGVDVTTNVANLQLQIYDFPRWDMLVDGKETLISSDNDHGLITVALSQGEHQVKSKLMNTPIRTVSNLISLFSLAAFSILCSKRYYY